jgi:invasion protein IalB
MHSISRFAVLATLACFTLSPALAQSTTSNPPAMSGPAATTHSAKSVECSKEADAKGLHGKARKKFRSKCKKGETGTDSGTTNGTGK